MIAQSFDESFNRVQQLVAKFRQGQPHYLNTNYQHVSLNCLHVSLEREGNSKKCLHVSLKWVGNSKKRVDDSKKRLPISK